MGMSEYVDWEGLSVKEMVKELRHSVKEPLNADVRMRIITHALAKLLEQLDIDVEEA